MRDDEQRPTETVGISKLEMPGVRPLLARGAQVGRYLILHPLGQGGMGVVYAGYDPELDRKVALKLLRPDRARGEAARSRLLREAQAIARLSHPNVVAVFDAGSFGDQVFLAMELVTGRTLREWLDGGSRSWREVVALFLGAGRGLAAAHAAGLVHRDFKPENVLLGDDGRVRVVDFGLARPAGIEAAEDDPGVIRGTPAYMAPEQLRGAPADARSDQYGFCVALWEALYGVRPGASQASQASQTSRRVPPWLRQALERGLSSEPADRHASMDALLAVLGRDPWLLRRRLLAAAAVLLMLGAAGLAWQRSRQALCGGGEERVAALWNAPRRQALHDAFTATRISYAEAVSATVARAFDRYFAGWTAAHREACEATRVRGEQSEEMLDRRMACLDRRLRQAGALVDVFAHADAGLVKTAVDVTGKLEAVDDCSDATALLAAAPRPRDPAVRGRIAAAEQSLARAQALSDAGRDEAALHDLDGVVAEARAVAYRPLEARALYLKGYAQNMLGHSHDAEATLFDAVLAAEASADRELSGLAAAQLARAVGLDQGRREEGRRWIRLAQSSVEGIKGHAAVQVKLLNSLGVVLQRDGLYREEEATYRQALALAERSLGADSALTATILSNLGVALNLQQRDEESIAASLRGLAIRRRVLAPDHPDLGRSYNTLGNAYSNLGRKDEALAMYHQARQVFVASYGEGHPLTASADGNIGTVLKDLKRFDEALPYYQRCLAAFQANEPDGPNVAMALSNLGELLTIEKRYAEALPEYRRALAIDLKLLGPSHPDLAYDLKGVADALAGLGRTREAIPYFERALAIRQSTQTPAEQVANSRYSLAKALWTTGDRERAIRLARQAYAGYTGAQGGNAKAMAVTVHDWLRERGQTP
jgi:tetratricopeptide (TPR) repeat protein/predicted Ser/Thr protein kinase